MNRSSRLNMETVASSPAMQCDLNYKRESENNWISRPEHVFGMGLYTLTTNGY